MQRVVKALLGYGAKMPKELMLYVKNMVFLDGAIARLAPDLDLIAEIANISMMFAERHGERLGSELGHRPDSVEMNMDGVKAGFGVDTVDGVAHLPRPPGPARLIQKRMRDRATREGADAMRLVVARCTVDYQGRLDAHLPEAIRLIMVKADGCVAIHADGGAYKPLQLDERAEHAASTTATTWRSPTRRARR